MSSLTTTIFMLLVFSLYGIIDDVRGVSGMTKEAVNSASNPNRHITVEEIKYITKIFSKALASSKIFQKILRSELPSDSIRRIVTDATWKGLLEIDVNYITSANIWRDLRDESVKLDAQAVSSIVISGITSVRNLTTDNRQELLTNLARAFLEGVAQGAAYNRIKLFDELPSDIKTITDIFESFLLKASSTRTSRPDNSTAKLILHNREKYFINNMALAFKRTYIFKSLFQPELTYLDRNEILFSAFQKTIQMKVKRKVYIETKDVFLLEMLKLRNNSDTLSYGTVLARSLPIVFNNLRYADTPSNFLVEFITLFLNKVFDNALNKSQEISKSYLSNDIEEIAKTIKLLTSAHS